MAFILNEAEVRELLPIPDLIEVMERALAAFSAGQVDQPVRTVVEVGANRNFFGIMPCSIHAPAAVGAKLVTVFPRNESKGLPTHFAVIVLLDPETGATAAVMDGRYITAARTAAVSAVAVKHIANRAEVLAIMGSGVQARSHLEALCQVRPIREVRAWSPTPKHLARFVDDAVSITNVRTHTAGSAEAAVRGADVVLLATASPAPVIQNDWVDPGTLVISIGAYRPEMREMDPELITRARVIVDSRAAALVEAGDIVQGIREGRFTQAHVMAELGDVVLGRIAGRQRAEDVVIFKSLGMAAEDIAAAQLAFTRAREQGKGREVRL